MTADHSGKIAVWTPELSSVNGQNMVTRRVVENQKELLGTIYEYSGNTLASIPRTLWQAARLALSVLRGQHGKVYLVCSRSSIGFLRDALPLFTSRLGARVIVHVHGSDFPHLFKRRVIGRFARWLYAPCEVIVPSHHLLELLAPSDFRHLLVCENFAVSHDDYYNRPKRRAGDYSLVVLWNSNIMASKGIAELVEGIRLLRCDGLHIKMVLLGKVIGDTEKSTSAMQCYLEELKQTRWIDVKGIVPPEDVPLFVSECDVIALPSTYSSECQPLAVIQGMLCSRALMITDTPAMRATVEDYPATFVERNSGSIAKALRHLVQNRPGPAKCEAALHARDRFSPDRFDECIRYALTAGE
ncbi:glycosyltransferase family 4 protein [Sulfitobacter sp. 1A15106]|uniref:glycosyltransferase family 4 protein n=1 Tax=Sulfitobacter sp. 1A15106 TaxID=3368590 RepID=UPI003745760B